MNDPFILFQEWFDEASLCEKEPNAMTLATSDVSVRVVLLKKFDHGKFRFFTNLNSRKARAIAENPKVAICFFWKNTQKQIRIEGVARKISDEEADVYFQSRPLESQIAALSSRQSEKMMHENEFLEIYQKNLSLPKIDRPAFWSGFDIEPNYFEFWQEGEFRTHKRVCFEKIGINWRASHLYP